MSDKIAVVTGGRRGIGLGIAESLAEIGYRVVATGVSQDPGEGLDRLGGKAVYIQADSSVAGDRKRLLDTVEKEFGRLDLLVNNAGIAPKVRADLLDMSEESFDRVVGTNLRGTFFMTQEAARLMIRLRKDGEEPPMIVNIGSMSAYTSSTNRGEYCMSKAGVSMVTMLFADRLASYGINVYEIRPGIIRTDMTEKVTEKYDRLIADGITPIKRWGTPGDIGKAVAAIAGGAFPFSTGEIINVDGGFHLQRL